MHNFVLMDGNLIPRAILPEAKQLMQQFRSLCITGPRQSGKTTLSRLLRPDIPYVSFENPVVQVQAEADPEQFLAQYKEGAILDEVQRVPVIFRYLQGILDNNRQRGQFILTGSNNFLLQDQVAQSLAGRVGYLSLLPLSYAEIAAAGLSKPTVQHHILAGGYPEIWSEQLKPDIWMSSYFQTYVQRDVRMIRNISNLAAFTRFVLLCANYAGQILNRDALSKQVGVDAKTIQAWLGLLESSYIAFLLQPWYNNLNKRIIKSPKLYFYDTALLCHLLRIKTLEGLKNHPAYGALFENWAIAEIRKNNANLGISDSMYFFRDSTGNEVDLLLEKNDEVFAIEIKAAKSFDTSMVRGIKTMQRIKNQHQPGLVLYGGSKEEIIDETINLIPWNEIGTV